MGQPAAKMGDKIIGTDIHIVMTPSPTGPVPTPTPLPFNGDITGNLSKDVFIEGKPAATVDSMAVNVPPHIVPPPQTFQIPPTNQGKIIIGSTGVFINGKPAARNNDKAQTCFDVSFNSNVLATGKVLIGETGGGSPSPPLSSSGEKKLVSAKVAEPGSLIEALWEGDRVKPGDEIKLNIKTKDFSDGVPAKIYIYESKESGTSLIGELESEVKDNKVEASWKVVSEDKDSLLKSAVAESEPPSIYYVVEIEGEDKKSQQLSISYSLDIYLEDEAGVPLDGVECSIKLSDGKEVQRKFKKGHVQLDEAPYGRFEIKIEGYDFIFD